MYNKYKNKKTVFRNIKFDSIKERNRYLILSTAQQKGFIKELELQKKFELQPSYINAEGKRIREISYIADFYYFDNDKKCYIVEDVKSPATRTQVYLIKKKLFEYKYNLVIKEI